MIQRTHLKLGLLSLHPINDPNAMSGTPANIYQALQRAGLTVIDLSPALDTSLWARLRNKIRYGLLKRLGLDDLRACLPPALEYRLVKREYRRMARLAEKKIRDTEVDVLIGICVSTLLNDMNKSVAVIYASDSTAKLLTTSYDNWMSRSPAYRRLFEEAEVVALAKCDYFLPACERTERSAIEDYGLSPDKVKRVEFGANIRPLEPEKIAIHAPEPQSLQLMLVAIDPIRKRLDFAIEVVEKLNQKGWQSTLNYIGSHHPLAKHPMVRYFGRLKLSDEMDRATHADIMANSHWMILPSKAEAFGIAPCEAAHFKTPSIVANVGGLPTVVKHGETGLVMDTNASADEYANAIIQYSTKPDTYAQLSHAAFERAQNTLSWDVWAAKVKRLAEALQTRQTP